MTEGLEFDPGFAPYVLPFLGTVNYLYTDINKFKNFNQRKMKFRQYYKKILDVFYNNIGFYIGCLMWASYVKTQKEQGILNNHCLNRKYNEEENTSEIDYMLKFVKLFPNDMKYFAGEIFEFDKNIIRILDTYKEFLIINKGFVNCIFNTNIELPLCINTQNAFSFKEKIEEIIETGDLSKFMEYKDIILTQED